MTSILDIFIGKYSHLLCGKHINYIIVFWLGLLIYVRVPNSKKRFLLIIFVYNINDGFSSN